MKREKALTEGESKLWFTRGNRAFLYESKYRFNWSTSVPDSVIGALLRDGFIEQEGKTIYFRLKR